MRYILHWSDILDINNSEKYDICNRWKDKDKKKSIQFTKKLNDIDYFRKWKQQLDNSGGFVFWTI